MINLTPNARDIADAAIKLQYDDIASHKTLIDFAHSFDDDNTLPLRDALIETIDIDLADMMHNCNLDFYMTLDQLNALTDDQYDALESHLHDMIMHDDDIAPMIADALIARAK